MKAFTSLTVTQATPYSFPDVSSRNSIPDLVDPAPTAAGSFTPGRPIATVLTKALLRELQQLTKSLQTQLRNSVALTKWLHRKGAILSADTSGTAVRGLMALQNAFGERLSFRFVTSPEAFILFTDTLLRKSYFLHHHAQVNPGSQLLQVRVAVSRLPELEQELSIVFENIKPENYLETLLLQKQQRWQVRRQAG